MFRTIWRWLKKLWHKRLGTPSDAAKIPLSQKFAVIAQLCLDLVTLSGNWYAVLELAEKEKNLCPRWLLKNVYEQTLPDTFLLYREIQQFLSPGMTLICLYLSLANKLKRRQGRQKAGKPGDDRESPNVIVLHDKLHRLIQLLRETQPNVAIKKEREEKGYDFFEKIIWP